MSDPIYYSICGLLTILVLFGIFLMSKVEKAVLGNSLSALALGLGIIITLIRYDILPVWILYPSMAVGSLIGLWIARKVKMIEMPEMVALFNGLGGAASAIVGIFAYLEIGAGVDVFNKATALLAITIGMITLTGSLVAAGKLHKLLPQKPVLLPQHALLTTLLLVLSLIVVVLGSMPAFYNDYSILFLVLSVIIPSAFGVIFTIRVGGADMPITISLLNSFSGVAGAISGLAIEDVLLVAVGGIVGASGLLLTQIMCKAMNRKLIDILLGKTTQSPSIKAVQEVAMSEAKSEKDPVILLREAKSVIIVPGYGMAIAQAQHLVKSLADKLTAAGVKIKYAVHPVAGRMPGHMNVLLVEAGVDYDDLCEMEEINSEFKNVDLTIVVGANDVMNPAARELQGTPIYGMPILNVDQCKEIIIFNYDTKPGYAGVDNPLYQEDGKVTLVLGNAYDTIGKILEKL
ncbi:MAG: NAD(P)(+) transhydrogenase (Re/Si-specific) subunit beta [Acholeplasmataceae bacterium]|nr:NAD(P)(+) transhydrogenase (Re/Si-specific) subunit beta [Acholeplasmataceae bacterium]